MNTDISVIFGFDMETDGGSWTPFYTGLEHGTPVLLDLLHREGATGTFFFVGEAARLYPQVVKQVRGAGHEVGCHSLYHETVGESLFPIPGISPLLPHEVRPRLELATARVNEALGGGEKVVSFRSPRLFGGTHVVNALEDLGYLADATLPMYHYTARTTPYHPDRNDWTQVGDLRLLEFPNFADLTLDSTDPYGRDRDQWPLFRTESAAALLKHVDAFIGYVRDSGEPAVLTFYFHPWEFWTMPQGLIHYGEGSVLPDEFMFKGCGEYGCEQFVILIRELRRRGAQFTTCGTYAAA